MVEMVYHMNIYLTELMCYSHQFTLIIIKLDKCKLPTKATEKLH